VNVQGRPTRTIRATDDAVEIIDQTALPHSFETRTLVTVADAAHAIATMQVRGAPLIGVTAAYGVWLAMRADTSDGALATALGMLRATRPTAVNLRFALEAMSATLRPAPPERRAALARGRADALAEQDVGINRAIGAHGLAIIRDLHSARTHRGGGGPINILTHCNAGWLATVDGGTALAGIYAAFDAGIPVHVWVDETRPRNQGALTAWELGQHRVPHTVVVDNAGGHLMQRGRVDVVLVGTDRTTATGEVVNKIGTYLKALAARDAGVPFYVAAPSPSIDWTTADALRDVAIEERSADEVTGVVGRTAAGGMATVWPLPDGTATANPGFDVTPGRLITGIITERGIAAASRDGLAALFPDRAVPESDG